MNALITVIIAVLSAYLGFVVHAMLMNNALTDTQHLADVYTDLVERFIIAYERDDFHGHTLAMIAAYSTAKQVLKRTRITA